MLLGILAPSIGSYFGSKDVSDVILDFLIGATV